MNGMQHRAELSSQRFSFKTQSSMTRWRSDSSGLGRLVSEAFLHSEACWIDDRQ